jgi:DNA-binding beta-propeller fold protein YncE
MNTEQLRIRALISLSLCACGISFLGGCGGGTSQINPPVPIQTSQPVSSGSSPTAVPTINTLSPSCAPAGEQFVDGGDNQLTVLGTNLPAGSIVRWNGSDRPTTNDGSNVGLTAQISAGDIAVAGTAVVTVFNPAPGAGSSNSLTFTITTGAVDPQSIALDPAGRFAYVLNGGCEGGFAAYVSMYTINPTTGALTTIGSPVPTYGFGDYPGSINVDPLGKFVYVTNEGDPWSGDDGNVEIYSIDAMTGALTPTGSIIGNCPGLCNPSPMVVDASGKFAYVVTGGAGVPFNIAMYTIDATTGALTSIGSIAAGTVPVSVAVDPAGKFVYVATANATPGLAGSLSTYAINTTTGVLVSTGTIGAGTDPSFIAVDPTGEFAYVTNSGSNNVSIYTINSATGSLASVGTIAAGTDPVSVAVDPAGRFAYVTNSSSNNVSMYTINSSTGSLTSIGMIAAELSPSSIAIHPSGKFAYVTNSGSNDVSMYSIGATGTLTLIGTIGT